MSLFRVMTASFTVALSGVTITFPVPLTAIDLILLTSFCEQDKNASMESAAKASADFFISIPLFVKYVLL